MHWRNTFLRQPTLPPPAPPRPQSAPFIKSSGIGVAVGGNGCEIVQGIKRPRGSIYIERLFSLGYRARGPYIWDVRQIGLMR